ncbi:hypothetical protein MAR_035790 [Mya arenaria]|uniref:Cadherin domain-containing protein n=1 Tax=Mya arenaria TaxID=6604 RepID=A0ABY7EQN5_MYAAR|nr:hypothetical protein MAR_035790 [Mya arenaria]
MTAKNAQFTAWTLTNGVATLGSNSGSGTDAISTGTVAENTAVGGTLFTLEPTPNSGGVTFAYGTDGNPSTIAEAAITGGAVVLASSFDFETTSSYVFTIIATEGGNTGTATITLSVTDAVELTETGFCLSASSYAAGSSIGTLKTDQSSATFATLAGTDQTLFSVASTGEITVATSQTVAVATKTYYTFTIVGSTTTTGVADSVATGIHVVMQCSSGSGAGQVVALISMLAVSVATHIFF